MKKIYIIGAVGTGKTTLAKKMSEKYEIPMYQLDKVVWDDENGNVKRNDEEIQILFKEILDKDSWIIEDVGRKIFAEGVKQADIVYYIDLPSWVIYKRCISRWFKQKLGKEEYNYKPTLKGLIQMLKWANQDIKNKEEKLMHIKENAHRYGIINNKNIIDRS